MSLPAEPPTSAATRIGGIVLCGGQSTRMGRSKALLPFGPETMLQRVVRIVAEAASPVVVVAAPGQALPPLPADVLLAHDEREGRGPLQGLHAGLTALAGRVEAAYATSCDTPLLTPAFVRWMSAQLGGHAAAVPVDGDFHYPLAAVYRVETAPAIARLLAADRLRPRFLFDKVETLRVPLAALREVDPELAALENLNRPEDYHAALVRAGYAAPDSTAGASPQE